ncbi:MAG: hypothetical protein ACYSWQ_04405 [Planctomycetota bacterium]|jgi:hypothetical protein
MKHVAAVAVVVWLLFAVGCAEKQQVKVTFLSDPPGGRLYRQNGQLWGPCPKVLWYDVDSEAMEKGRLDAKGLIVRWPTGPEKRSEDLIKITVNGTDRQVIFVQPEQESKPPSGDPDADNNKELDKKAADWQKAKKAYSAESERIRTSLALMSKNPIAADRPVASLPGRTLTLEPRQLMLLDFSSRNRRGARVEGKRVVSGPGVEFEIYFPSNSPGNCSMSFVSSGTGGRGMLVGADVRAYEAFALKLTLVSINGQSDPKLKQKLVAGAVIGPTATGRLTSYEPVTLSLEASEKTVTAVTAASADEVYEIGFHIHAENREDWDATGSRIVLKVEAAEGGETGTFNAL